MKLDSDEDVVTEVIGGGNALDFICHRLARANVDFFVKRTPGHFFLVSVDKACCSWLRNAIYEYATKEYP